MIAVDNIHGGTRKREITRDEPGESFKLNPVHGVWRDDRLDGWHEGHRQQPGHGIREIHSSSSMAAISRGSSGATWLWKLAIMRP
jgi:hypothetical protein